MDHEGMMAPGSFMAYSIKFQLQSMPACPDMLFPTVGLPF